MYDKVIKNIEEIGKNRKLENIFKSSLSEIKFNKKSFTQYLISILIGIGLSYIIVYKSNTVEVMKEVIELINDVSLAFVAIIFGTYAIFQALMTDSVIWTLLNSENNLLNISNKSFLHLIILYLFEIILNIVLLVILKCIPFDFCIFRSIMASSILAIILTSVYLSYCFLLFYEIKNFAVNLYQMFNVYNIYRALDIIKDHKFEDDGEKNN